MTWVPNGSRWVRQHKGHRYVVSVRQLRKLTGEMIPETKDGSRKWANAWWKAKEAELAVDVPHPHQEHIDECKKRLDWARANGDEQGVGLYGTLLPILERSKDGLSPWLMTREISARGEVGKAALAVPSGRMSPELVAKLNGDDVWEERLSKSPAVPEERRIGRLVPQYLELRRPKVVARSFRVLENTTQVLIDRAGENADVGKITENFWREFYLFVSSNEAWSDGWKKKVMVNARAFVAWAAEEGLIDAPRNLRSKQYVIEETAKAVETLPPELVREWIERAHGQLRLHLLLMANCGMTQQDIADVHPSEVDWEEGRITRKRSKSKTEENVPTVCYKLWPDTLELLKQHRSNDPHHLLLTSRGSVWVSNEIRDGVLKSKDQISVNFNRIRRAGEGSMKLIRKTSASLLDNHPEFSMLAPLFLGHAPQSVADRHYLKPAKDKLDRALSYLHSCYFPA